jgi:hypothetical protein
MKKRDVDADAEKDPNAENKPEGENSQSDEASKGSAQKKEEDESSSAASSLFLGESGFLFGEDLQRLADLETGKGESFVTRYRLLLLLNLDWDITVTETIQALSNKQVNAIWPRDTLFKYLQLMEDLQENLREYEELQYLATCAILNMHDG